MIGLQAFDGSTHTKWLDFGGGNGGQAWLEYALSATSAPVVIASYTLTSANDFPERDPRNFVLEGTEANSG